MGEQDDKNPYGFGNPQYRFYKEGWAWACGSCGYVRATVTNEEPKQKCAICGQHDWNHVRKWI